MQLPFASLLALLVFLPGPPSQQEGLGQSGRPADIVLHLNGAGVTRKHYESWLLLNHGELDAPLFARTLRLRHRAKRLGVSIASDELRRRAREEVELRLEGAFAGDRQAWEQELTREGRSVKGRVAQRMVTIEAPLLLEAILSQGASIDEEELVSLWEQRHGPKGRSPRIRLLRKRFRVPFEAGENTETRRLRTQRLRAAARAEMLALLVRAQAGDDFVQLIAQHSDHPSKDNAGLPRDLSWRHGFPSEPLDELALAHKGQFTQPIYASGAFWILQQVGVDVTPLEEVRSSLEQELRSRSAKDNLSAKQLLLDLAESNPLIPEQTLSQPEDTEPKTILFRVGQEPVTRAQFGPWLLRLRGEQDAQRFALEERLQRFARAQGIVLDPADLATGVERARATDIQLSGHGGEEAWLRGLQDQGLTAASWRRAALRRIQLEGFEDAMARAQRHLSEAELRIAWEQTFGPGGLLQRVRWIQLNVPPLAVDLPLDQRGEQLARLQEETRQACERLRARVLAGEDFAALAQVHSVDTGTAARGGAPADDFSINSLPEELRSQLGAMETGAMTQATLLESGQAVVLLQLTERRETPFEEARAGLEQQLMALPATHVERAGIRAEIARELGVKVETERLIQ